MINCRNCKHYYITWEKHFPHGCRAMGFKSAQLPAVTVRNSSHKDCLLFKEKAPPEKEPERHR